MRRAYVHKLTAPTKENILPSRLRNRKHKRTSQPKTQTEITALKIQPFILSCDSRLLSLEKFIESFRRVSFSLKKPLIYAGFDNPNLEKQYTILLKKLNPLEIIRQPPKNKLPGDHIRECMILQFPEIIAAQFPKQPILTLEDDIIFSKHFPRVINHISNFLQSNEGIITLFGEGANYLFQKQEKASPFLYKFNGQAFYGNQAVVFSKEVLNWWKKNKSLLNHTPGIGGCWDLVIARGFTEKVQFNWYCTYRHYVQHQICLSIASGAPPESMRSNLFTR